MLEYHDKEWGVLRTDDIGQFEHIILETFQAGLSWLTILKKRKAFREDFEGFDPEIIARFTNSDVNRLLNDARIIRSHAKITAAVNNAHYFLEIVDEFGSFYRFLECFRPRQRKVYRTIEEIPTQTPESERFAKELKLRGFKFIGPVSGYAHLQSVGIVNDHVESCFRFKEVER